MSSVIDGGSMAALVARFSSRCNSLDQGDAPFGALFGHDGREMTQTIIAHGNAGNSQKVIEVIVRTSANAAQQRFVSHRKMPQAALAGSPSDHGVSKVQVRDGCPNATVKGGNVR
jgi:hypothetical protein